MHFEDLRLGFIADRHSYVDDAIWVESGIGRLLETWAGSCRGVTVGLACAPTHMPMLDMRLSLPVASYFRLPWMPSIARGFHKVPGCRRVIREVERRSDAVIVQLPFPAPLALLGATKPRVYHICADIYAMARASNYYSGYRRLPAVMAGNTIDLIQRKLLYSRNARTVTNGSELLAHYGNPPGQAVVSATILDREIQSVPRQRPADAPFRILYVGYLRFAKGIDLLFDAFDQILDQIPNAELVIAGPIDVADGAMSGMLDERLAHLNRKGSVKRVGHLKFGPELFQQYADADVLALPSRSEGTPRVLVEARAFGCPVVGTRVGGIPTSIEDGEDGLIVPTEDSAALRDAILRIARDQNLREKLVAGGIRRARASTVEAFARTLAGEVEKLFADRSVSRIS
jgi:glycosyltransferase involved in cell wall biosynthesis